MSRDIVTAISPGTPLTRARELYLRLRREQIQEAEITNPTLACQMKEADERKASEVHQIDQMGGG